MPEDSESNISSDGMIPNINREFLRKNNFKETQNT